MPIPVLHRSEPTDTAPCARPDDAMQSRSPARISSRLTSVGRMVVIALVLVGLSFAAAGEPLTPVPADADLELRDADVTYDAALDLLVFRAQVAGAAGATIPQPRGQLDGAPVLGYVFPTSLAPGDVGFGGVDGVVALAVTSHPDFDDTPLWDEDNDGVYDDDGPVFHTHWVVLVADERVGGGLAVAPVHLDDPTSVLPPTNPGMPMFMDSPGFSVVLAEDELRVLVPAQRVGHRSDFTFDAVVAYMQVNTSDPDLPMLGVYTVYDVLSGDLSLPFAVSQP